MPRWALRYWPRCARLHGPTGAFLPNPEWLFRGPFMGASLCVGYSAYNFVAWRTLGIEQATPANGSKTWNTKMWSCGALMSRCANMPSTTASPACGTPAQRLRHRRWTARAEGVPLTVIMSIWTSSRTNDTFGHPTGDRVLEEIEQVLQSSVRSKTG